MGADTDALRSKAFQTNPYRPDGGMELQGLFVLLAALALAGAVLGFAANFVSQWFYLILIFPIGIGMILGAVGVALVAKSNMRNPIVCGAAGLIGGLFAMVVMHYAGFLDYREYFETLDADEQALADIPEEERQTLLDQIADEETRLNLAEFFEAFDASADFPTYIDFRAKIGVSIGRTRRGEDGINLGYTGTLVYWLVEIAIVAGIVLWMVKDQASAPFCKTCRRWKDPEALGFLDGEKSRVKSALESGRISDWLDLSPNLEGGDKSTLLTSYTCSGCQSMATADLKAEFVKVNRKGQSSKSPLSFMAYPGEAYASFRELYAGLASEEEATRSIEGADESPA